MIRVMLLLVSALILAFSSVSPMQSAPTDAAPAQVREDSIKVGRVKGIVTYNFNSEIGEKADVGSEVFLVAGSVDVPAEMVISPHNDELHISTRSERMDAVAEESKGLPYPRNAGKFLSIENRTRVDANGTFDFEDVSPGPHTVFIRSSHTNGAGDRDRFSRWAQVPILVKSGARTDASCYFSSSDH